MSNVFNIADRPGRDTRLLDQARDAAIPPLVDAFAMALGRFDDALFDRAERAGPSQMAFLDAMRELRRRREDIIVRFRAHLQRAWKSLQEGQPLSMETAFAQGADDTLTLVTDQELESRLAVRNLASVIQRDCKPVLLRLDRRLGWIAGDVALDSDLNPIGPEHIGVAVHQAFSACDLAPEVRWVYARHRMAHDATTAVKMEPLQPVWMLAPWPMLFRSSVSCGEIFTLVERLCCCAAYTVFRR